MTKIKVAQIVCQLPPQVGGLGRVADQYSKFLHNNGFEVEVFIPQYFSNSKKNTGYLVSQKWPLFKKGFGAFLPQLLWQLRKFQIVHLHYPFFGSAFFVSLAKRLWKNNFKLIITYHQDVQLVGLLGVYEKITRKLLLRWIMNSADKIIISSEDYIVNSHLQEYYLKNIGKFIEIPFAVSEKYFPIPKKNELLKKLKIEPQDKVIVFVGGLDKAHYFKGINFLLKSIPKIEDPNIKVIIIGKGNMKRDYENMAKQLNITHKVIFTGYIADDELPNYYNLADIFILPSINQNEAFGLVLIEAMACGIPLIASNLKGVRRVVYPGINGLLVEPKNSDDIAQKINHLIKNPELRKQFSELGLKMVKEKYTSEIISQKLKNLYQDLLKK